MKIKHLSVVLPTACTGLLSVGMAIAAERTSVLEEIVVTAQKRDESLQDIPVAVTALTSQTRELIGITTIEDMTNFVPGLTYEGQLDRANIRGAGRVINAPGTDPAIGLYTDGFYNSSTTSAARSTIFNERVEVLRGPQSSLYGRNTTGGAINTVSRAARDTWGSEVRATYGNFDRHVLEGTVTGPLTDWLRFRATAASTQQDEGYFKNVSGLGDEGGVQDDSEYEFLLSGDLGEAVDFTLRYTRREQWSLARWSVNFAQPNYAGTTGLLGNSPITGAPSSAAGTFALRGNGLQPSALYNGAGVPVDQRYFVENPATLENRRLFSANVPTERELEASDQVILNLVWHLPFADLKYIGGIVDYQFHSWSDTDGIARQGYDYTPPGTTNTVHIFNGSRFRFYEDKQYWSNEFNLTSTGDGPVQWLLGLYQYHEKYEQVPIALETSNPEQTQLHTVYSRPTTAPPGAAAPLATHLAYYDAMTEVAYDNPHGAINSATGVAEVDTYAVFGQVDWKFADNWKLSFGGRFSRDEKQGSESRFAVIWDPTYVGSLAKAFDNSAPFDCVTDLHKRHSFNPNFQSTVNAATGQEIALTNTSQSYTSSCRTRKFNKYTWDDWTGQATLEWSPMQDFMTYLKYSRGYKSGAIRFGSFSLDAVTDPEHINAYEFGMKATFGGRLQLNSSLFYYDYEDYQFPVQEREDDGQGGSVTRQTFTNLEKAESYGLELEALWNPFSTLSMLVSYSYLHTEILSDLYLVDPNDLSGSFPDASPDRVVISVSPTTGLPTVVAQNVKGNKLPGSPEQKVAVNVNYTFHFGAGSLTPSLSYSWRDRLSSGGLSVSAFSRGRNSTPSYETWDGRITWSDAKGRYSIIGYVANLFDDQTVNSASSTTVNGEAAQIFNLNPPRTYGITAQFRFGSEVR